jgi:uncharacterized phage-associated protein
MASPIDVARYLIHLAAPSDDEDVDCLCHLRLQKLLYYVQGWHLAAYGKPLFAGRIEAWTHGPVVRELYPVFAGHGYQGIPPEEGAEAPSLSSKDKDFIRSIWEEYKQYSATALRTMTHKEGPWLEARGSRAPDERCDAEITHQSLLAFFRPLLEIRLCQSDPRIDKAMWEKSRQAMESGKGQTTQEVRRELHRRRSAADPG